MLVTGGQALNTVEGAYMMYIAFLTLWQFLCWYVLGRKIDRCELFSRRVHYSGMGLLSRMVEIGPACEGGAAAVRHFSHAPGDTLGMHVTKICM